jgi:hypothetical protein
MSNISINQTGGALSIGVQSNSLLVVSFSISIYGSDGTTVLEFYTGDTTKVNPAYTSLPQAPSTYVGDYVAVTLTLFDPSGGTPSYNVDITINQGGAALPPATNANGAMGPGINTVHSIFHLQ